MPTVKELRVIAKQFGLRVGGRKAELEGRILNARNEERVARQDRNRNKGAQQIEDEITAALRAKKVEKIVAKKKVSPEHKQLLAQIRNKDLRDKVFNSLKRIDTISKIRDRVDKIRKLKSIPKGIKEKGAAILERMDEKVTEEKGRRVIKLQLSRGLDNSTVDRFMSTIETLQTAFYLRYSFTYRLRNIENGKIILFHTNLGGTPVLITNIEAAKAWLTEKDQIRLSREKLDRPSTKWAFDSWFQVNVKIILANQPLLGAGRLPDWLRQKKGLYALDTYDDNLCVFHCLALHRQNLKRPDRTRGEAVKLAKDFYGSIDPAKQEFPKLAFDDLKNVEEKFKIGIRVYVPEENGTWFLVKRPARYDVKGTEPMTLGYYNYHAFLISDINKVAKVFACPHCNQQFTQACHLQRHDEKELCSGGKTKVIYRSGKIQCPQSAFERAFYPRGNASYAGVRWIEFESSRRGSHIHHAKCGHGGEHWIADGLVDGYGPVSKTVFQFHGCQWHGCPEHCVSEKKEKLYEKTIARDKAIIDAGFRLVVVWECKQPKFGWIKLPEPTNVLYPHAIVFDFEAYQDKTKALKPTDDLTFETVHVPISVSIGDDVNHKPTHLCNRDPKELIKAFLEEIKKRAQLLGEGIARQYMPPDFDTLPENQQKRITDWCRQVPVLGYNSGRYDLNLIKNYFAEHLTDTYEKVDIAAKGTQTMFLVTPEFKFLDVINYVGPGKSYSDWVKAYGCKQTKSWFPYEWFDSPDKLDYPELPDYECWHSKLKNEYLLTEAEFQECKKIFREKNMTRFADWLKYYNDLDVEPFIEAADKMKAFYFDKGLDMFKDASSLPGISMQYLLRGTLSGKDAPELYAPGKEAYDLLKAAVSGGPSLVFTRYHEAGKTRIRSHQFKDAKVCVKIGGYDASALYLSTMLKDMPCGKERVLHYEDPKAAAESVVKRVMEGTCFGFVKCKLRVPKNLWPKFEEMCPIFVNREVSESDVPEHMLKYLNDTGRKRIATRKLLGVLEADEILLYTPLLRWYIEHGLVVDAVYTTIEYDAKKIFVWFVEEVTKARRMGDESKAQALLAEVFKLLGNAAYGKFIEALERHTSTRYTKDEKIVDCALRSAYFEDLTEIGSAYEIECRKPRIDINRPFQIGIAVYQLAKLRVLEFYYDFLDKFVDRRDFEMIQMDTDSLYFAMSAEKLEDVVRPELQAEFEACKNQWIPWNKWSERIPGLFKVEYEGTKAIALCSKCYFVDGGKKAKLSSKGVSKKQNDLSWSRYKAALEGSIDRAENRGFRMHNGQMTTYLQAKLGLSAYYDKRRVLPDGIHTEPLEYHV
jgi:hypothetical protein